MQVYIATTDSSGNLKCAAPIEQVLQNSTVPAVSSVDLNLSSSGVLSVSVVDITGNTHQDTQQLPTSNQNISTWANGTTQSIVLGSDGLLYLANPTGAPSTHNPVNKTNNVDWYGAFQTMNDLLKYALGSSSYLVSSAAPKISNQAAAPASPSVGDKWRTTSATVAPYAKDVTYEWTGSSWALSLGAPQAVVTSTGTRTSAMGVGTSFNDIDFTLFSNDLNADVTFDRVTVPRDGYYSVDLNINPDSLYTTESTTGGGLAFYTLEIWCKGALTASTTNMVFINPYGTTITPTTLGTSCNTLLNGDFTAGDTLEARLYLTGLTLSYSLTMKLTNLV